MRMIGILLRKEFLQIFRNKSLLIMMFVAPSMQLIILPLAANFEVKNIHISIVDYDKSIWSQKLISKINASGYFNIQSSCSSYAKALEEIESDRADLILQIPSYNEKHIIRDGNTKLFIAVNAINGMKANVGAAYLQTIISQYSEQIQLDWGLTNNNKNAFQIIPMMKFNPTMNYRLFMVPGILALLITLIGGYMTSLNIVKEKESGTIEQINVTPIKKYQFVLGKLIPFWIIGMLVFSFGLWVIARVFYNVIPAGNILALYVVIAIYLSAVLGMGLLVSTFSNTQMQAMSLSFFFMMIFMLMSGLFTPIDSMPDWARFMTNFNPVKYLIEVIRLIVLKGSSWHHVRNQIISLSVFSLIFNSWAIFNYKKRS